VERSTEAMSADKHQMPDSLFSPGEVPDSAYRNLQHAAHAEAAKGRDFTDRLWRAYAPYADNNF